jgi:glutathione synthase/RimK-type ligase-like ATP-grasp enzyme
LRAEADGVEAYRFNTEDYPHKVGIEFDPLGAVPGLLVSSEDTVQLGDVRGIWVRRPVWPTIDETVSDPLDRNLAFNEAIATLGGFLRVNSDRCVSHPDALQAARWKLPALRLAKTLGLRVPRTLVTSDSNSARAFASQQATVIKAVGEMRAIADSGERYGYTTLLTDLDLLAGPFVAPVLLQEAVRKIADTRVTMVGSRAFAVDILVPPDAPIDFRATSPEQAAYSVVALPSDVERALLRFMGVYGLRFACFDLMRDSAGDYWFLECNPSGQYGWLEFFAGVDITGALLHELVG